MNLSHTQSKHIEEANVSGGTTALWQYLEGMKAKTRYTIYFITEHNFLINIKSDLYPMHKKRMGKKININLNSNALRVSNT